MKPSAVVQQSFTYTMFTTENLFLFVFATQAIMALNISMIVTLVVALLTCGRGSYHKITKQSLVAMGAWYLGDKSEPAEGPIFGRWYFGYVTNASQDAHVWFLHKKPAIDLFNPGIIKKPDEFKVERHYINNEGSKSNTGNKPLAAVLTVPYNWQRELANRVTYSAKNEIILLTGDSNTGKSSFPEYLASVLVKSGNVAVYDLDPTRPYTHCVHWSVIGTQLYYEECKCIIFVIDEVDAVLDRVFNNPEIPKNTAQCGSGTGKSAWNAFLDDMNRSCSAIRIITILTCNRTRETVTKDVLKRDATVLRNGRITMEQHITADMCAMPLPVAVNVSNC
jgi:energy-coupling factor transporter ATP-binding protein EcfA2